LQPHLAGCRRHGISARRIPAEVIAEVGADVERHLDGTLPLQVVAIVESDPDLCRQAVQAVRAALPGVDVIAAGEQRAAMQVTARRPALLWLCDSDRIDAERVLSALRGAVAGCQVLLRAGVWTGAPERDLTLGVAAALDGAGLLQVLPGLVRALPRMLPRHREALIRLEVGRRLRQQGHPEERIAATGYGHRPRRAPVLLRERTAEIVLAAVHAERGNLKAAAGVLGIGRKSMYPLLRRLDIDIEALRSAYASLPRDTPRAAWSRTTTGVPSGGQRSRSRRTKNPKQSVREQPTAATSTGVVDARKPSRSRPAPAPARAARLRRRRRS
jgi:hypothetical protein